MAALGRSLAAVGGRLEALLVAAASQGLEQKAPSSSTILTGRALTTLRSKDAAICSQHFSLVYSASVNRFPLFGANHSCCVKLFKLGLGAS